jgi:FtsP/CotA-like multicopper oxidase with cupredoxin domain
MKKRFNPKLTRRQVLKAGMIGGAGLMLPLRFLPAKAFANGAVGACDILGCDINLNDPALVKKFVLPVPDALDPSFKYAPVGMGGTPLYRVGVGTSAQVWGLKDTGGGRTDRLSTNIFGYGQGDVYTWPGKTFEVQSGRPNQVQWQNNLNGVSEHLLPVDTTLHWCYSLHGFEDRTIDEDGVPIVVHLHGGHTTFLFDGNPEQFFTPNWRVRGPRFRSRTFMYLNDRPAGNLWYHDHALGITRLNVCAGMAGFYFVRDEEDTGLPDNPLGLPAWPYEKAYAIQDRMFDTDGQLFYPAFPDDPYYDDFIETPLPEDPFGPEEGPTALAEFFGDHMVVNGRAWPKEIVEPRQYRLHLLNGTDSRFMAIRFRNVRAGATDLDPAGPPLPFYVIGSDQGLASSPTLIDANGDPDGGFLLSEPGSRYDIVFDFSQVEPGTRVIMENIGGDEPFGGDLVTDDPDLRIFACTDRIMAFDVVGTPVAGSPPSINFASDIPEPTRTRKVALFEGMDEFGRLQPLLGTAEPATDFNGMPINWPDEPVYANVGLTGQMEGSIAWHSPSTENPAVNTTEEWEIWNVTGDAHPVHLHLVHFEILGRKEIKWDSHTTEDDRVIPNDEWEYPEGDGTYLVTQPTVQHNSVAGDPTTYGTGFKIMNQNYGPVVDPATLPGYVENAPKDMVTALPDQVTRIKATFDKPGRYVWHCHILSHEDHEMMRTMYVGPER